MCDYYACVRMKLGLMPNHFTCVCRQKKKSLDSSFIEKSSAWFFLLFYFFNWFVSRIRVSLKPFSFLSVYSIMVFQFLTCPLCLFCQELPEEQHHSVHKELAAREWGLSTFASWLISWGTKTIAYLCLLWSAPKTFLSFRLVWLLAQCTFSSLYCCSTYTQLLFASYLSFLHNFTFICGSHLNNRCLFSALLATVISCCQLDLVKLQLYSISFYSMEPTHL